MLYIILNIESEQKQNAQILWQCTEWDNYDIKGVVSLSTFSLRSFRGSFASGLPVNFITPTKIDKTIP